MERDVHTSIGRLVQTLPVLVAVALLAAGCAGSGEPAGTEAGTTHDVAAGTGPQSGEFCALAADVAPTAAAYSSLAAVAPEEVRTDLERFAKWLDELQALDESESRSAETALRSEPEYLETVGRITGYLSEACGIGSPSESDPSSAVDGEQPAGEADRDPSTPDISQDTLGGVPEDEVKAKVRELFGDRVWGTSFTASHEQRYEYEANVYELTPEEALPACEELSMFLAGHAQAAGTAVLRLTDYPRSREFNVLALNERIIPDEQGRCETTD